MKKRLKGLFALMMIGALTLASTIVAFAATYDSKNLPDEIAAGDVIQDDGISGGVFAFMKEDGSWDSEKNADGTLNVYYNASVLQNDKKAFETYTVPENNPYHFGYDVLADEFNDLYAADTNKIIAIHLAEKQINYTVNYDANGASGSEPALAVTAADIAGTKKLSEGKAFTKDGFTLTGWNSKADGTGEGFGLGIDISTDLLDTAVIDPNAKTRGTITLYAQWKENSQPVAPEQTTDEEPKQEVDEEPKQEADVEVKDETKTAPKTADFGAVAVVRAFGANI